MLKDIIKLENITKIYDNGIVANDDINIDIKEGEIHAIVGENGAGKSTLMKVIFGMEQPTKGDYYFKGEKTILKNVEHAIDLGIGMVHQHFMLVDSFNIVDNIVLGIENKKGLFLDKEAADIEVKSIADKYMFDLDYNKPVGELSVGMKQKVEILKALIRGAKILILDEPTAVLTPQETDELFSQLRLLRDDGHTIIFISHKLNEVKEISDRITIIRSGKTYGTYLTEEQSVSDITKLMVGRDVVIKYDKTIPQYGENILEINDLSTSSSLSHLTLNNINFSVREGMILGVAGVEGNGQAELIDILTLNSQGYDGEVLFDGISIKNETTKNLRNRGFSFIPEDRMGVGIAGIENIKDNVISNRYREKSFSHKGFLNNDKISNYAHNIIDEYDVVCNGADHIVNHLSGGNIQKVVVGRECNVNPKLLIAEQPTRGVDLGAAETIHHKLLDLREEGTGILLISADLNEVLEVSDECIVLYEGEIVAHLKEPKEVTESELGEYMLGINRQDLSDIYE